MSPPAGHAFREASRRKAFERRVYRGKSDDIGLGWIVKE
jgi:hypothetical protein